MVDGAPGAAAEVDPRDAAPPEVIIPHHDTQIRTGDRVIVFMPGKKVVRSEERLFQVSATPVSTTPDRVWARSVRRPPSRA